MVAVAAQERAERLSELDLHGNVRTHIQAVLGQVVRIVVSADGRVQRHHKSVITRHASGFQHHVAAESVCFFLGSFSAKCRSVDALRFGVTEWF